MYDTSIERLLATPRVALGKWPTPIERLEHSSIGPVLVKRDDLAGFGHDRRSGVKARKLETFLAHLQNRGVEVLTMPLGNITNLGGDLARIARESGVDLKLLIADDPPLPAEMRACLFKELTQEARLSNQRSVGITGPLIMTWLKARLAGKKAFAVLPSPSHPSAVVGMARGYFETLDQIKASGEPQPRAIYIAAAAGTSVAGLALAEALMRSRGSLPVQIVAVQVTPYPLRTILPILLWWTRRFLRLGQKLDFSTLHIVADPRHTGYGRFEGQHVAVCNRLETEYGLTVDPIYGAKSWNVMEERESVSAKTERAPLFWHCGYTPQWRMYSAAAQHA